jgi:glycosyltransferase involved in cell wall biosynthesis
MAATTRVGSELVTDGANPRPAVAQQVSSIEEHELGSVRAHLIINDELPIFPGSGGVEYLTTLHMAQRFEPVGLVSMVHRRIDLLRAGGLAQAGVRLFLWQSPFIDATPAPQTRATLLRRLHATMARAFTAWQAWPDRPRDTVQADSSFRNLSAPMTEALSERHWPTVSVVQSHAARFIDHIPRPVVSVLVMHDVRALIYERRARIASSVWDRWRHRREARRYARFEREYCPRYDLVATVSDSDAAYVRQHYAPQRVVTRRLPIDASYWQPSAEQEVEGGMIVFTGLMNHPPNVDAAVFMARDVFPRIRSELPVASLWIVGRHPHAEVLALADLPGVQVTGEVPDVRPFLARAAVVVVPLRYGSGSRQKILEAWAMQKCVVSTTIGAEGLDCEDGTHLVIADGMEALAKGVLRALCDRTWRATLCRAGREVVLLRHDPCRITNEFADRIAEVAVARAKADQPMRVAIDMRWMIPGMAGGIEQVARAFLSELLAIDRYNRYTLIAPARVAHGIDVRRHPRVRVTSLDGPAAYLRRAWHMIRRRLYASLRFDDWRSNEVLALQWVRSLDAELVYAFPGFTHPDVHPLPQVLMVPDIQHEYRPEYFTPQALEERSRLYRDSIRRATRVCAISEFTRQTLIDKLGVPPAKVTTVHLAADPVFRNHPEPADATIWRTHGLERGQFLFLPGHTWHHKNHLAAVRAVAQLRDVHGIRLPLVCTGGTRDAQPAIEREVDALGLHGSVRFLGYCPQEHLPALYRGAACLVFPSLFEGFGMPVLEAMACGCPVVCSNSTSLPEISGDAALLIDPEDPDTLARAVANVIRSHELRDRMRECGLARARQFSWRRHTTETLRVLYEVHQMLRGVQSAVAKPSEASTMVR